MLQNELLLYNSKKALLQAIGSPSNSNCYSTISSYPNICYLIKLFTKKSIFYKPLEIGDSRTNLSDIFGNGSTSLPRKILLTGYINSFWDNWGVGVWPKKDYSFNELTIGNNNFDFDTMKRWAKEIEIDYN